MVFLLLEFIPFLKSWVTLPPLGYNCKTALVCTWEEKEERAECEASERNIHFSLCF